MDTPVLTSTLLLTLLLLVGLFFFVKASVKERLQQAQFVADQPQDTLNRQLQDYFTGRAYRVSTPVPDPKQITFEGLVRPSVFLAGFLTFLAAVGLLCLGLVLAILLPQIGKGFLSLTLLAPAAGLFYWRGAERVEQVKLQVEPWPAAPNQASVQGAVQGERSRLTVTAHRDEIIELQRSLKLREAD